MSEIDLKDHHQIPYGYVYRITNLVNRKTYIGQRKLSKDNSWRQYMGSGKLIIGAMEKYGKVQFVKELIGYKYNSSELDIFEMETIIKEKEIGKAQYNLAIRVPQADNNLILNSEQIQEWKKRISSSLQKSAPGLEENPSHLRAEKRYQDFLIRCPKKKVLELYEKLDSIDKVSISLKESPKYIWRLISEEGEIHKSRNTPGHSLSEEHKFKISQSNKKFSERTFVGSNKIKIIGICPQCKMEIHYKLRFCFKCLNQAKEKIRYSKKEKIENNKKEKFFQCEISVLKYLNSNTEDIISIREISRMLNIDRRIILEIFVKNRIAIPKQDTIAARKKKKEKLLEREGIHIFCQACQKDMGTFYGSKKNRKYCSHKCYLKNRYNK